MTTVDDDPFARQVGKREEVIRGGRYRLPNRDGTHHKGGWQRVSNLVGAYSDQFALRLWELEQMAMGVKGDYALYRELMDTDLLVMDKDTRKRWVEDFTERCKKVAGGAEGSVFGINRHTLVEDHHAGLPTGFSNSGSRRHLSLYASALVRNRLMALPGMQERRIMVERLGVVGTFDNILEDLDTRHEITALGAEVQEYTQGDLFIGDLKTQKKFWTFLEIAAQLACYANADAMWDPVAERWVEMPKVSLKLGKVLWMPRVPPCALGCIKTCEHPPGEPRVDVYNVDIEKGWKTAQRAYEVVQDRAEAKGKSAPWGWLAPAPGITETERYAALFAAVDSVPEGAALVREVKAKGLWGDVLADCAKRAKERLSTV